MDEDIQIEREEAKGQPEPAPEPPAPARLPGFDETPRRPSVVTWLVLGALVLGAIGYGLLRDDSVLIEDDFSSPEALRAWPYGEQAFDYEQGLYHVATAGQVPSSAFRELPRSVDGMWVSVQVRVDRGDAVAVLACVEAAVIDDESAGVQVEEAYSFVVDPSTDSYAIVSEGGDLLDEGPLDVTSEITVGCASDGSMTTLSLRSPGGDPIDVEDPRGATFMGIALGAVPVQSGGEVVFDDLRVTEVG